jgi:hypothetical protein
MRIKYYGEMSIVRKKDLFGVYYYIDTATKKTATKKDWTEYNQKNNTGLGAIYKNIPKIYECKDGTYSTAGCNYHGGKKSKTPIKQGEQIETKLGIRDIPLDKINIDKSLFQGREKDFSQRSVENIISDVESGKFVWENLDPITLWQNKDGKLFLLSGHSRFEAFKRLAKDNKKSDGKDFKSIPAKTLKNTSLEKAKTIALESNTLSTKETDLERSKYYRRLRQDGKAEKQLLEELKKNEGRNWVNIYAYTFLNPDGKAIDTLKQFIESEDTSATLTKSLIKWIGMARKNYPDLTNDHEREIYTWLFDQKGYGSGNGQVSSEREFNEKISLFIAKNTFFGKFDNEKPLNIQSLLQKSPVEREFDEQISEAKNLVSETEKELKSKIKSLTDRGGTKAEISKIVEPIEIKLRNQRIALQKLLQKKDEVIEYSKRELQLFGLGKVKKAKIK